MTGWSLAESKLSRESPGDGLGGQKRGGDAGLSLGKLGGEPRADRKLSSLKSGSLVSADSFNRSCRSGSVASVSEDRVEPATKLGSSALVSEGGEVPESLALQESSLESRDDPDLGELGPGDGAVSGGEGGFENKFGF